MENDGTLPLSKDSFTRLHPYAFISFISSIVGFLLILVVIVFPVLSANIAVAGLYFLGLSFLCGVIGLFRDQDPKGKLFAGLGILSSVSPFLLYFLLVDLLLRFLLRGLG